MKLIGTLKYFVSLLVFSTFLLTSTPSYASDFSHRLSLQTTGVFYKEDVCPIGQEFEMKVNLENTSNAGNGPFTALDTKVTFTIDEGFKIVGDYNDLLPNASMETVGGKMIITADYGEFQKNTTQEVILRLKPVMTGDLTAGVNIESELFDPNTANNSSSLSCAGEGATMKVNGMPTYDFDLSVGIPTYQFNGERLAVSLSNNLSGDDENLDYYFVAQLPGGSYYSMVGDGSWVAGIMPAYSGKNVQFEDFQALDTGQLATGDYLLHYGITKPYDTSSDDDLEIISLTTVKLKF